jgi:hypothetical protein
MSQTTYHLLAMVDELSVSYERLALVVGSAGSGKSEMLREAASVRGWPRTSPSWRAPSRPRRASGGTSPATGARIVPLCAGIGRNRAGAVS